MLTQTTLINGALTLPMPAMSYHIGEYLLQLFPDSGLLQTEDGDFALESYAQAGLCELTLASGPFQQQGAYWNVAEHVTQFIPQNVWYNVGWEGQQLQVLVMHIPNSCGVSRFNWVIAPTAELATAFFTAVCAWNTPLREEIMVFEDGYWNRSHELYLDIKNATLDNLILPDGLKEDVHRDIVTFLSSRPLYERFKIPWKRGVLLIGPPGNGKTHMVKALLNSVDCAGLYVKSFSTDHSMSDQHSIRTVFTQAREMAPCILVMEDLDSLVHDRNRSFFLNELDGFAGNDGILTLATTNHPDRLDPAIINRPSRFDRKYHFGLPALRERHRYLAFWNQNLEPEVRMSTAALDQAAEATADFSFAYLKELFISSLMGWMSEQRPGAMDEVMAVQVELLREQMSSAINLDENDYE